MIVIHLIHFNIVFSGFNITGSLGRSSDLETFLNRDTGHRIVAHANNITDTKLYKSIDIAFDYTMKLDASITSVGDTYVVDDYGLSSSINCGGTLINASQQLFFSFEVTTELRDDGLLHGNLT